MIDSETDFGDDGERVVASNLDWNYYSHLSVYKFASKYTKGLRVIDAGCGTGYGTAYLARAGAQHVIGLDVSEKAILYCRNHCSAPSTQFAVADLSIRIPAPTCSVDVIFSSQAMEHLSDIETFLAECRRVMTPRGIMIAAVPAIISRQQLEENIWNNFHVTNLTPLGWYTKMHRNFSHVAAFSHWPTTRFSGWSEIRAALQLCPEDTIIRETDFDYVPMPISTLNVCAETLNTVLIAQRLRRRPWPPQVDEFVPHSWSEGAIHAKVRREETQLLRWKLWQAAQNALPPSGDTVP